MLKVTIKFNFMYCPFKHMYYNMYHVFDFIMMLSTNTLLYINTVKSLLALTCKQSCPNYIISQ